MQSGCVRWFAPAPEQQTQHRNSLDKLKPETVLKERPLIDLPLADIDTQDRGIAGLSARASQPLAKACNRVRRSDLGDTLNRADVDPKFECRGANRRCGLGFVFDRGLDLLPRSEEHTSELQSL